MVYRLWAYGWLKKPRLGVKNVKPAVVMLVDFLSLERGHQKNSGGSNRFYPATTRNLTQMKGPSTVQVT